uniref:Peptidase M20 dimerisation domain-containing protein n=1 Tax=Bionectria ochroleuca TaxID=29856 RepID=A0A8H7N0Z0_BIOOC
MSEPEYETRISLYFRKPYPFHLPYSLIFSSQILTFSHKHIFSNKQRSSFSVIQEKSTMESFYQQVDKLEEVFIERLRAAIEIPSVSEQEDKRDNVFQMAKWLVHEMESLGIQVKQKDLGKQPGKDINLPPLIIGRYGSDPSKPTILAYSHYDVQPAALSDGWDDEPFELTQKEDGRLCGRGTSDDKGPLLNWLNMIQAFKKAGQEVPSNLVFCFEGMEESGSQGLADALKEESTGEFAKIDSVCITDTAWSTIDRPTLIRGLRGIMFYHINIDGAESDAHSGAFGGSLSEPMTDMVNLMASLVDSRGEILVPGIYDDVLPVSAEERKALGEIKMSKDSFDGGINGKLLHEDQADNLIARSRKPALSLHGIERASPGKGASTIIPGRILGRFSIRTVANMNIAKIDELVQTHLKARFQQLGSKNKLSVQLTGRGDWFFEEVDHWNYQAAIQATEKVWG